MRNRRIRPEVAGLDRRVSPSDLAGVAVAATVSTAGPPQLPSPRDLYPVPPWGMFPLKGDLPPLPPAQPSPFGPRF